MFGWIARVFGTVAAPAPPEPIPMVVEDEDADLQLTPEELRQAEIATECWPFVELSRGLRARYEGSDGDASMMSAAVTERWKERAASARIGASGLADDGTRAFEDLIGSCVPRVDSEDYEKAAAVIRKKLETLE